MRFRFQWQVQSRAAFLLFGAAALLFISYIVIALLAKDTYYAYRLAKDGRTATATVIKKVVHRESDPRINRIGTTTGVSMIVTLSLIVASALGLLGARLAVMGLCAVTSRGWTTVLGPPRLQFQLRVSPRIVIGGILLICGVTFLLLDVLFLRQERPFHAEGMTATALVLTKSSHVVYNQQNRPLETKYDVGYRFTTQDGESVQGSDEVAPHTWKSIRERDPIQIVYLRDRPARSRLVAAEPGAASWIANVVGGALAVGGALLLGYGMDDDMRRHRMNQQRKAASSGNKEP
jgi:hypothetical protein